MDHQLIATWAQVGMGVGQLLLIAWGLWQLSQSGKRRDRALDQQAETLGKIGQARERQGEAMTKAVTQQGEVFAALLRRSASQRPTR